MFTHAPVVAGVTDSKANVFVRTDQATSIVLRDIRDPFFSSENRLRKKVCQVQYCRGDGSAFRRGRFPHSLEGRLF